MNFFKNCTILSAPDLKFKSATIIGGCTITLTNIDFDTAEGRGGFTYGSSAGAVPSCFDIDVTFASAASEQVIRLTDCRVYAFDGPACAALFRFTAWYYGPIQPKAPELSKMCCGGTAVRSECDYHKPGAA